jgi:transposase
MERLVLTDVESAIMAPNWLEKPVILGGADANNRLFVGAVLWIAHTGSPWRDLPTQFGNGTLF